MRMTLLTAAVLLGAMPRATEAQVSGAIVIGGWPVGGIITIGAPHRFPVPARRVVFVERFRPDRVIVVERWYPSRHERRFDPHRYHRRVIWYDGHGGRYYDRARPGLRRIDVYERDGRYYRRDDRDDRRRGERRHDRDR